ncbi:MAG TPA: DEAD/DEAH box helicase [Armatimonadota bacterium]|jgi:SNF2 family DNA or RNA helicase
MAGWWRLRPIAAGDGSLARPEAEAAVPVARLIRFASQFRTGVVGHAAPLPTQPAAHRLGFARLWPAHTVDLRAPWKSPQPPLIDPETGEILGGSGSAPGEPPAGDELAARLRAVLQIPLSLLMCNAGPLAWPAPLLPFQQDGALELLSRPRLLLADDMGLGKTVQAIAALRIMIHRGEMVRALVAAPAGLLDQWRREITRWAPELRVMTVRGAPDERAWQWRYAAHVTLVSYETLRNDVPGPPERRLWDLVILDEASRIRNRETGIAQACKRIPRVRRWALTGTPLENSVDDLVSIFDFLTGQPGEPDRPWQAVAGVRARLRELQLRRRKEDVLPDLPPKRVIDVPLELGPLQRAAYDRAETEGLIQLRAHGPDISITHVLELITRLKQVCNADPVSGESAKLDNIRERMATLVEEGHRALVFSQFVDASYGVERAARALASYDPLSYSGAQTAPERTDTLRRFEEGKRHKALILSLRAGGVGLNLQSASYVFHLDRWWNPALEDQAESRAHRLAQPYPVTVYRYICEGTIEERIERILQEKRALFHDVVDDVTLDLQHALTESEIYGLFGLHRGRPLG